MAWRQIIFWTSDGLFYLRIYGSLALNDLTCKASNNKISFTSCLIYAHDGTTYVCCAWLFNSAEQYAAPAFPVLVDTRQEMCSPLLEASEISINECCVPFFVLMQYHNWNPWPNNSDMYYSFDTLEQGIADKVAHWNLIIWIDD